MALEYFDFQALRQNLLTFLEIVHVIIRYGDAVYRLDETNNSSRFESLHCVFQIRTINLVIDVIGTFYFARHDMNPVCSDNYSLAIAIPHSKSVVVRKYFVYQLFAVQSLRILDSQFYALFEFSLLARNGSETQFSFGDVP